LTIPSAVRARIEFSGGPGPLRPSYRLSIRQCLTAFGAALVMPGLIFAAILLWTFGQSERSRYEQEPRDAALRIAAAR
jgi:hypothetical protein